MFSCENRLKLRYKLTLVSGLVECLCFSGVVFGWASLVFVLKEDGYFSDLCVNVTRPDNNLPHTDCTGQDEQFSLIFTIASFLNNFLSLPNGFVFDYFGTMATRFIAVSLYTTGTLMVAASSAALCFIAVGGIFFLITNIQVGNLFGAHRSTIITLYNGAFDSSSAIFFIIKVLFEAGISFHFSFLFLTACSVIHFLRTIFLMPKKHIPYLIPDDYTYGAQDTEQGRVLTVRLSLELAFRICLSLQPGTLAVPETTFRSCLTSSSFLWHLVWLSVMQLRHYFFIGTLNPMLNQLSNQNPALVSQYTNAFAFTQLCGVLCAPWNGLIMDRHKGKPLAAGMTHREADLQSAALSLFITSLQCLLFSICAAVPVLPLQYITFIIQVLNRAFLYGGNAAFISVAFPSQHFGKLFGVMMSLSAVVALLQYPCFALVKAQGGDTTYVNIALTLLTLLAFIHPLDIYLSCRRMAKQREKTLAVSSEAPMMEAKL
uniref:Solute carrier family 43 member 3 n=1 Tax=Denticeps clupeoides TaxID=299321 RepID=A0AAY4A2U6_9TELE